MPLSDRQCPNPECRKTTCQYGNFCKHCGAEMPLPDTTKERRGMLRYQLHSVPTIEEGVCEDIYHFIVGYCCSGNFCDQCGKQLTDADRRVPEV